MIGSKGIGIAAGLAVAVVTVAASMAHDAVTPSRTTARSCSAVMAEEVCTWVTMEGNTAVELGATIPMTLVEAVPADADMIWPPEQLGSVPLPTEAQDALGIDHLGVNWEAHGHPPASFMTQHFDFHFYNVSESEVRAIDCADPSKPARLPARYALPDIEVPGLGALIGLCVPHMGMHAMLEAETTETDPFEASMMMGYYRGTPIFFEPMISRELLLRRSDFSLPVPGVDNLPEGVVYPSAFRAEYDSVSDAYQIVFSGFRSR